MASFIKIFLCYLKFLGKSIKSEKLSQVKPHSFIKWKHQSYFEIDN